MQGMLLARKCSPRAGINLGQEAEVILEKYLGSTYKAVQAPREAATASTENTHGPFFSFTGIKKEIRNNVIQ